MPSEREPGVAHLSSSIGTEPLVHVPLEQAPVTRGFVESAQHISLAEAMAAGSRATMALGNLLMTLSDSHRTMLAADGEYAVSSAAVATSDASADRRLAFHVVE